MEFADLHTLVIVARERSFSRAAVLLHRTQPAISLAIRRLEHRTGTPLFTRETRRPELTEAGRMLVAYAQEVGRLQQEALGALSALRGLRRGDVRIEVDEALVAHVLPLVGAFRAAHPEVGVVLGSASTTSQSDGRPGDADVAVVSQPVSAERFEITVLGRDRWVLAVAPDHPFTQRACVSWHEVARQTVIGTSADGAPTHGWAHAGPPRRAAIPVRVGLGMPSLDAVKRAVACGLGVAVLPAAAMKPEMTDGRLAEVALEGEPDYRPVCLARSRERTPSIAADAFFRMALSRRPETRAAGQARSRPRVA